MQRLHWRLSRQIEFVRPQAHLCSIWKLPLRASMSVHSLRVIGRRVSRRLLQRLRDLRGNAENPYSPAASLALLLAVGIVVKFH
jgi:hypothetical protein